MFKYKLLFLKRTLKVKKIALLFITVPIISNATYANSDCSTSHPQLEAYIDGGAECSTNRSSFTGSNIIGVTGKGSTMTFSAPDVTVISNVSNQTHAIMIGGGNEISTSAGSTLNTSNLTVTGAYGNNASTAIYIQGSDRNNPDTLNVTGNLTITGLAGTGAALRLNGAGSVANITEDLLITTTRQIAIRNYGTITVNKITTLNTDSSLALIQNLGGTINFLGNVSSTKGTNAIDNTSTINFFGQSNEFVGNVLNNGLINLSNNILNGELSLGGDYSSTNGILRIDTKLDSDSSPTDFIKITGKATGTTNLEVNNVGGNGALTNDGIHVIQTGFSEDNAFILDDDGHLTAGKYIYSLTLKNNETTTSGSYDNWYLTNTYDTDNDGEKDDFIYSPDVGAYLANEMMGNTLFTSRLEDREGASQYQTLGSRTNGNVWIRTLGGHNKFTSMSDQLKTKGDSFVTQIGTGLVTLGEEDQYNLGAMAGYAHYSSKTKSNLVDLSSKSKMNGYSVGLYGTWYAFPLEKRGAYIDSWVLWNSFKNTIDTADQHHYKYDSSGVTASVELGGNYLLNQSGQRNWWIQPQSQIIYQGVHMDDFYDAQDYKISHGSANVQARMGFKTYIEIPSSEGAFTNYRPYVAMNFIHNTNPYAVNISGEQFETQGSQNLGEFKLGIEGNLGKDSYVWANASYVSGSHSNQAYQGNIGWKYNF